MTDPSTEQTTWPPSVPDLYARALHLNARLASEYDPRLIAHAKAIADELLTHVRQKTQDFEDFERRVERSEEFCLHESAQVAKTEKDLKTLYLSARSLFDAIAEAEDLRARFGD